MTVMSDQMITDAIMNGAPFICWSDACVLSSVKSVLNGTVTFLAFVADLIFVFVMSVIFLYPLVLSGIEVIISALFLRSIVWRPSGTRSGPKRNIFDAMGAKMALAG